MVEPEGVVRAQVAPLKMRDPEAEVEAKKEMLFMKMMMRTEVKMNLQRRRNKLLQKRL